MAPCVTTGSSHEDQPAHQSCERVSTQDAPQPEGEAAPRSGEEGPRPRRAAETEEVRRTRPAQMDWEVWIELEALLDRMSTKSRLNQVDCEIARDELLTELLLGSQRGSRHPVQWWIARCFSRKLGRIRRRPLFKSAPQDEGQALALQRVGVPGPGKYDFWLWLDAGSPTLLIRLSPAERRCLTAARHLHGTKAASERAGQQPRSYRTLLERAGREIRHAMTAESCAPCASTK